MTWMTAVVGLGLLLGATWEHRPGRGEDHPRGSGRR
jgi:hypothetical protein